MSARRRRGQLLAIGGGEDRSEESPIHRRFVELAGGAKARLVLCGAASDDPEATLEAYAETYRAFGVRDVHAAAFPDRAAGEDPELLDRLREATAVFLTGGDQLAITSLVAGTPFGDLLGTRFGSEGLIIGGTSAGAAAMASTMLIGGREAGTVRMADVELAPGLGYWPDSVIDTHFNQRGRTPRLLVVFAQNPQVLGVGLDEDTAVEVRPGEELRVIGSGAVTIFDGRTTFTSASRAEMDEVLALSGVTLHVLANGYGFDLVHSKLLPPEGTRD